MQRINWAMYPHTMPATLCVGEEKRLDPEEIERANELIADMWESKRLLEQIFNNARHRFANRVVS